MKKVVIVGEGKLSEEFLKSELIRLGFDKK
jgi:hypothetical protein